MNVVMEEKKFNETFQLKKISYKKRIMNLISLIKGLYRYKRIRW